MRHVTINPYLRIWSVRDLKGKRSFKYRSFIRDVVFVINKWDQSFTLSCADKDLYELIELNALPYINPNGDY